jgi:peptidoglycan/xylan/chitin deacetylase (PgdA/CDA1 family)
MRLDRLVTLNLVQPFRRALAFDAMSLPVLMYHSVSDDSESGQHPYYRVCTSSQIFREQMQCLKDNGCRGVTLSAGLEWLKSNPASTSARHVAITFDDGFSDFYTDAFPILRQYGFSATMYLPTVFIGQSHQPFKPAICSSQISTDRKCLTWGEVKELHCAGIEFGSHTVHHPRLVDLSWPDIQSEIQNSKAEIEERTGCQTKTFAYPYAFPQSRRDFVDRFKDLLITAGYETSVTTQIGRLHPDSDLMEIRRLPVNSSDDTQLLQAKLDGSYDWLAVPQGIIKKFKRAALVSEQSRQRSLQRANSCEVFPGNLERGHRVESSNSL